MSSVIGKTPPVQLYPLPVQLVGVPGVTATLYNRVVSIMREKTPEIVGGSDQIGYVPYSGPDDTTVSTDPSGYVVLFTNLPCAIEPRSIGRTKGQWLPSDVVYKPTWRISIPAAVLPIYSVRDRDVLIDDEQYRYSVGQNVWTTVGYALEVVRLET